MKCFPLSFTRLKCYKLIVFRWWVTFIFYPAWDSLISTTCFFLSFRCSIYKKNAFYFQLNLFLLRLNPPPITALTCPSYVQVCFFRTWSALIHWITNFFSTFPHSWSCALLLGNVLCQITSWPSLHLFLRFYTSIYSLNIFDAKQASRN